MAHCDECDRPADSVIPVTVQVEPVEIRQWCKRCAQLVGLPAEPIQ